MVGHFIQTQRMATTVNPIIPLHGRGSFYMKGSHGLMHLATRDKLRDLLVTIGVRGYVAARSRMYSLMMIGRVQLVLWNS